MKHKSDKNFDTTIKNAANKNFDSIIFEFIILKNVQNLFCP